MITSIRCVTPHKHGIYDTCGSLLGGISEDAVYFHCTHCKDSNWYKVQYEDGGLIIKKLPSKTILHFEEQLKVIE